MRTLRRSRGLRLLTLAASLVAAVWLVAPPGSVPLYDGIGFPDEPYRYVVPPPGYPATPPPTPAYDLANITNGVSSWVGAASTETGPQVSLQVEVGGFSAPAGTTHLTVRADPVAPPAAGAPDAVAAWSNVYAVTATGDAGGRVTQRIPGLIFMRAPAGPPPPAEMEYDDGTGWRVLKTTRTGTDIYSAPMPGLGRYALVRLAKTSGRSLTWLVIVPATALALLCGVLVVVRIRRKRGTDPDSDDSVMDDVARFAAMASAALPSLAVPEDRMRLMQGWIEELRGASDAPVPERRVIADRVQAVVEVLREEPSPPLTVSSALIVGRQVQHRLRS